MRDVLRRFFMALLLAAGSAHAGVQVTDDRGVQRSFARPPQRIVSLLPSLTETVCVLQACARLVGVDDFSTWPQQVQRLPHVGGLDDARVESIVALRPDLVLAPTSSRALPWLVALGLPVLALEPRTLADVQRVLRVLGPLLAAGNADAVWQHIAQGVAAAARSLPPGRRGTRVYVEVGSAPYAAGAASFIGELLQRLGAANVVPPALGPFPKLNPEFVVRADPQVIVVPRGEVGELRARPGWQRIAAVRDGRICGLAPQQDDVLMRAGPRLAEAAALLVQCLDGRWP